MGKGFGQEAWHLPEDGQMETLPKGRIFVLSPWNWARYSMIPSLMAWKSLIFRLRNPVSKSRSPVMYFCFCSPS